jgi:kumamolisin
LIESFAAKYGLQILNRDRARRCVVLSGTIAAFSKAFAVEFAFHQHRGHQYRSHQNEIQLPSDLAEVVEAVLGLENRPLMSHHAFAHAKPTTVHTNPEDVAKAYQFPTGVDGTGQRIAIVELGGGFYESDLKAYFKKLNLKMPKVTVIELDGQRNDPSTKNQIREILDAMGVLDDTATKSSMSSADSTKALWTIEATLDTEIAGSFANGAEIIVYFAPNNSQGKYHALSTAIHSEEHPPTILSCSWGAVEETLSADFVQAADRLFQDAALRGITVCFSSGDKGEDPDKNGNPRVHFPASSPNVLSCGGTHWETGIPLQEVVWNEKMPTYTPQTGGGVSKLFGIPSWQSSADVFSKTGKEGRGVPDVAGKADMTTGYEMIVGGYSVTMGGTSSAVPMWAGLIARLNQELGKNIGYLTSLLYEAAFADSVNDITQGNNGAHYHAEPGWDACTGLGTPNGAKLLAALRGKKS